MEAVCRRCGDHMEMHLRPSPASVLVGRRCRAGRARGAHDESRNRAPCTARDPEVAAEVAASLVHARPLRFEVGRNMAETGRVAAAFALDGPGVRPEQQPNGQWRQRADAG
jgi:hypothetical protein